MTPTPHKWAHVIKAWADGKTIQYRYTKGAGGSWQNHEPSWSTPGFGVDTCEWRVPVLHQEAWDHYAAGGDVRCKYGQDIDLPPSLWHHTDPGDRAKFLKDDRWDDPMFTFTIVPKEVVETVWARRGAGGVVLGVKDQVIEHNLKLTFNTEGKLLKAEVIG